MEGTNTRETEAAAVPAELNIYQDVDLSLTEQTIPPVVHVKQFDHKARKVRCHLYSSSVEYTIPGNAILSYSGTRPDGSVFQYSNESAREKIFLEGNSVILVITDFMTMQHGRFPVDVILLDDDGEVLGAFSLTLKVERAAVSNRKIATATYAGVAHAVGKGIYEQPCLSAGL